MVAWSLIIKLIYCQSVHVYFITQPSLAYNSTTAWYFKTTLVAVKAMRCWTSLHVRQGRTCNMRATIPAASGAAADVPVWVSVHPVPSCMDQSDVTCGVRRDERKDHQQRSHAVGKHSR